jgi:hypothetical protein
MAGAETPTIKSRAVITAAIRALRIAESPVGWFLAGVPLPLNCIPCRQHGTSGL